MAGPLEVNLIRRIALGDIIRRRSVSHGDKEALVAYVDERRISLTYDKLNERLNQFVYAMRERGVQKGDRVAIIGSNSIDFITALMGSFKGGFVTVPINFFQSPEDIRYNIEHSGARAIFSDTGFLPQVEKIADMLGGDFIIVELNGQEVETKGTYLSMNKFLNGHEGKEIEDTLIEDDDLAQIMYTSGTTARPKGVMASHKNLFISSLNSALSMGIGKDKADIGVVLPLFHITAELAALLSLHLGGKLVLFQGFAPDNVLKLIESERINTIALLPMMWKALLAAPDIGRYDYSSLDKCMYGMAPMDAVTLKALRKTFECSFYLGSGQTEIAGVATRLDPYWGELKEGNYWGDGSITCDQAVMDEGGKILPKGEIGEIVWRSPQTMMGYYKNEAATAEAQAYGWHHSGDIGYIDDDNQLRFIDRKKDIVKSGGENVSSVKIEESILEIEGVVNAGAVGLPHPHWGEALTVFVTVSPGYQLTETAVLDHCRKRLGRFEVPKKIVFLDQFPMTATGKVKKHMLRMTYENLYDVFEKDQQQGDEK